MNKKLLVTTLLLCLSIITHAQSEITEKGYFYSPNGFICENGNIYTADMSTMVKACYPSLSDDDISYFGNRAIRIPSGAQIIPSHLIYHTDGKLMNSGNNTSYCVIIPSSVRYIAIDAFLIPYIKFFSGETDETSVKQQTIDKKNSTEIARYNIQGQRIQSPERGINIVQMSDRTAYKEVIK